jgi:hypothetical protein
VEDTEAVAETEPGLEVLVAIPDDTHSSCLHSAYSLVVEKNTLPAVEEAVAAPLLASWKAASSSSVCGLDSWELEAVTPMNSWSGSGLGAGQHRRCSRKPLLARNSKHARTGWDVVPQNGLAHNPPCCQWIMMWSTSPVLPNSSGRCWDAETPTPGSRGQPPRPQYLESQQPLNLPVDADGIPSYVDQMFVRRHGGRCRQCLVVLLEWMTARYVV